jgi:hypothetical protein
MDMMKQFKLLRGHQEKRWFTIDVGHIQDSDVQYFLDQLRRSMSIPSRFLRQEVLNEPLPTQDIFIPVRNEQL